MAIRQEDLDHVNLLAFLKTIYYDVPVVPSFGRY